MSVFDAFGLIRQDWLDVGDGHQLFLAQYGDADGIPVLYLHGGPGAGCSLDEQALFRVKGLRIYMLDQRAAGRSKPYGRLEGNDLVNLLTDIEKVRQWAGVARWCLLGGSFGATLGYLYSCIYPQRVLAQVLWSLFIPSAAGIDWLYGRRGVAQIFSSQYRQFVRRVDDTDQLLQQFEQDFNDQDSEIRDEAIQRWLVWELALAAPGMSIDNVEQGRVLARIELHYARHDYFGAYPLMQQVGALLQCPTVILQGELDWVCPQRLVDDFLSQFGPPLLRSRLVNSGHHTLIDTRMRQAVSDAVGQMIRYIKHQ